MMNPLEDYFYNHTDRFIHKWKHFFEVYDFHFSKYRNREVTILEIGVSQGGSLQMWKNYFGDKAKIYGVDVNPSCKQLEEKNISIFIGSQSDRQFMADLRRQLPPIDILIDDGGHTMEQQIVTFEEMFSQVKEDGIFLIEDLHTSYWKAYGGGYARSGTFIEYSKKFIDYLNAWHSDQQALRPNPFTKAVWSLTYYDSILVIQKRPMVKPGDVTAGKRSFEPAAPPKGVLWHLMKFLGYDILETILRALRLPSLAFGRKCWFKSPTIFKP